MKKRVVAFLLSMTLCSAMVVEAGAAAVGDFTAPVATEDVFSDSETSDQESTEETQPGNDPAENGTAGDVPADGTEGNDVIIGDSDEGLETPPDENLDDTITDDTTDDGSINDNTTDDDITDDGADTPDEEIPGEEAGDGSADVPADEPAGDEPGLEVDFSDGLSVSGDNADVQNDIIVLDDDPEVMPAANFETEDEEKHTATLLWSRWENVDGKWKLQKLPKVSKGTTVQNASSAEDIADELAEEGTVANATEVSAESIVEIHAEDMNQESDAELMTTDIIVTDTEDVSDAPSSEVENNVIDGEISDAVVDISSDVVPEEQNINDSDVSQNDVSKMESTTVSGVSSEVYSVDDNIEYYKNQLLTVTVVDSKQKVLEKGTYYFDKNGYLVTGRKTVSKDTIGLTFNSNTEFYFLEESKTKIDRKWATNPDMVTPYNSNYGQMQKNYWLWDGTAFHNYGNDGGSVKIAGDRIYQINGKYYYLRTNGTPFIGVVSAVWNNRRSDYCFEAAANSKDIPGKMGFNRWCAKKTAKGNQWLYFGKYGRNEKKYSGVYKLLSYKKDNTEYLIDDNGYQVRNKVYKVHNGYYYAANGSGVIYRDCLIKTGNYRYYYGKDGRRASWTNRWIQLPNKRYYFIGKTPGRIDEKKGIHKVTVGKEFKGWYCFDENGNNYQNRWVKDRYYLPDGRMASGPVMVRGEYKYFFELSTPSQYKGNRYKNKWIKYNNKYYYAIKDGRLYGGGWKDINGGRYYFENWNAVTRKTMKDPATGKYGWLDAKGKHQVGWIPYNSSKNQARYIDPKTGEIYKNTVRTIDGKQYRFNASGDRVNDRTNEFRQRVGSYYLECDRVNGVMTIYTNQHKTIPIKTIRVSVGNPWTPTPLMKNEPISRAGRWQLLMGPSWGQYGTHVRGGIYIHSVASGLMHGNNLPAGEYLKLGNPASHGCIRCCVADAKWVWDNCNGSWISIVDGKYNSDECFKGPLGRNPLTPLRGSGTFDPTDPNYN